MDVPQKLLELLAAKTPLNSLEIANDLKLDHQAVVGGIKSLQQVDGVRRF